MILECNIPLELHGGNRGNFINRDFNSQKWYKISSSDRKMQNKHIKCCEPHRVFLGCARLVS